MAKLRITDCPNTIAIIGTGEFSRAISTRLQERKYNVVVGSRFPEKRQRYPEDDIFSKVKITSIQECVNSSDLVIVAISSKNYGSLAPLRPFMQGKILVDVSNSEQSSKTSNAERLANVFPESVVVKAFNTISAYAMLTMYQERTVHVCGDDFASKQIVKQLANMMGLSAVDAGALDNAAEIEEENSKVCPDWGWPTFVMIIVSIFWIIYVLCRYYVMRETPYDWYRIPTNVINKMAGCISITLLALTYIPGPIAACKQLINGTKHKRFPKGLDRFLRMRKQLGLYALLFGLLHCMMSVTMISPAYYGGWFNADTAIIPGNLTQDLEINIESRMNWLGELLICLGFCAIFTMSILGLTSIPSIANSMTWKQWQCTQSWLGLVCLMFTISHVTVKGAYGWVEDGGDAKEVMSSLTMTSVLLAWFALLLRLFLLLPCVFIKVKKIREGWERGEPKEVAIVIENGTMLEHNFPNGAENKAFDKTTL